ncbi:hypothetical protein [Desertibacillus haloalkaliphilus]|nr:hypothetical protein [Desertibacillus haloalkaliphilus]MBU8907485.1 hypothetical protein [Desertibacillus haloalkaliphilus]
MEWSSRYSMKHERLSNKNIVGARSTDAIAKKAVASSTIEAGLFNKQD